MKNYLLAVTAIFLATLNGYGQYDQDYARDYKAFKVGIGIGYAVPGAGEGAGGGFLGLLVPAYRATDEVVVGVRLEGAFLVGGM